MGFKSTVEVLTYVYEHLDDLGEKLNGVLDLQRQIVYKLEVYEVLWISVLNRWWLDNLHRALDLACLVLDHHQGITLLA